ncbi:MAG: signal peptidase I [Pisciglobus halotolerans]|nr:signal peptidase I [Pisciglobus halotolerans]
MMTIAWKKIIKSWLKAALIAALFTVIIRNFIFLPISVSGSSMIPTITESDQLIIETISSTERFDIVVFRDQFGRPLIKRVIGLPGESIRYEDDQLFINDKRVEESFLKNKLVDKAGGLWTSNFTLKELTGNDTIPESEYFVMGDNRRLSNDSRYFGSIKADSIIGEVLMVYYPFKQVRIIQ